MSHSMSLVRGELTLVHVDNQARQVQPYHRVQIQRELQRTGGMCDWLTGERLPVDPETGRYVVHADHVIPRSYGGETTGANLRPASPESNQSRGNSLQPLIDRGIGAVQDPETGHWRPDNRTRIVEEDGRYVIVRNPDHYDVGYAVEDATESAVDEVARNLYEDIAPVVGRAIRGGYRWVRGLF